MMLDKQCKIYRAMSAKDGRNRPIASSALIGSYPCALSSYNRRRGYAQETPNATKENQFNIYGPASMDIKAGDIVEIDGIKYIASVPNKPRNHHTECDIFMKGDA